MSCLSESSESVIGKQLLQEIPGIKTKCFVFQYPNVSLIEDILTVYKHVSLREEDFLTDLYYLLKGTAQIRWKSHCLWAYKFGLTQEKIDKAKIAFKQVFDEIAILLKQQKLYDEKGLIFNSVWIQKPDIFVFFRTEHSDVDFSEFVDYHAPDDSEHPA
jgi:hypothetical protein